ncbi:MAG: DNA replication/repair protein RecF [Rhodospirillaceae bacterium]|nr:DNA replication/repair protein RecF [Rhodospirillaceae bacterium]
MGAAVAVTRLNLAEFRNYESLRLEVDGRPVVLTGPNGAGKTNLLEALSFLAPGRGLRRAGLTEVARRPAGTAAAAPPAAPWAVSARLALAGSGGGVTIGTGLDGDGAAVQARRVVRIDGRPAKSQTALGDWLSVAWLTPQMDRLFLEGPGERRRFLDRLAYGLEPEHARQLSEFDSALRERGRLLKDQRDSGRPADPLWLDVLEERLAGSAVAVAAARRDFVRRLAAAIAAAGDTGPFPRPLLSVVGTLEQALDGAPALAVEDAYRGRLKVGRRQDMAAGTTLDGPHRSDMAVVHAANGRPAADCSTGEQKALLIALVLAHARLLASDRGAVPILLLDEIAAHLDQARRTALFAALLGLGAQAWLTGTDGALFGELGQEAQHFSVQDGRIGGKL